MTDQPDYDGLARLLTLRYDPCRKAGQKMLSAASFSPKKTLGTEKKVLQVIEDILEKDGRIRKAKNISVSLSGGVDSGLTVAMMRKFLPGAKLHAICAGFGDDDDEVDQAREVARLYNCDFTPIIIENALQDLPKLITAVKEPRWNLYGYYALAAGKKSSDIMFTGDGGDEIFGGYTFRYQKFLSLLQKDYDWKRKANLYLLCHERDWVPDQESLFGPKIKFSWDKIYTVFEPYFDNRRSPLDQVFLADFNGKLLYDWIPANTEFGRELRLEIRSLFTDERMIRLATHIPWQMKYDPERGVGKLILRSILSKQKGSKKEPAKKGFSIDLVSMWKKYGREMVSSYVNEDSEVIKRGLINYDWVKKSLSRLGQGSSELNPRYINKIINVLALEVWYRLFFSKTMKSTAKL